MSIEPDRPRHASRYGPATLALVAGAVAIVVAVSVACIFLGIWTHQQQTALNVQETYIISNRGKLIEMLTLLKDNSQDAAIRETAERMLIELQREAAKGP